MLLTNPRDVPSDAFVTAMNPVVVMLVARTLPGPACADASGKKMPHGEPVMALKALSLTCRGWKVKVTDQAEAQLDSFSCEGENEGWKKVVIDMASNFSLTLNMGFAIPSCQGKLQKCCHCMTD